LQAALVLSTVQLSVCCVPGKRALHELKTLAIGFEEMLNVMTGAGHAGPVFEQKVPQLSVPVFVWSQVGAGALQEPSGTQTGQAAPTFVQYVPQLSVPVVVWPQAGAAALQEPLGMQLAVSFCHCVPS
jgi:hypothetical protein